MNIIDEIERSGLGGRGGAGFDTATKIRAGRAAGASLIVNACDGERGAVKDAWVVAERLGELDAGARIVADGRDIVYAAHRGSATAARLEQVGLPVLHVPPRYVSSEETSLVSLLHGGLARPMSRRRPFVFGGTDAAGHTIAPTLVMNAETLWRVAQIADHGADWFRGHGTPDEPGPRLVALTGAVPQAGVVETAAGVPLRDLLRVAGTSPAEGGPLLVGGMGGIFLTSQEAAWLRWSSADLAPFGGGVGAGVIEVLDPSACPLEFVGGLLRAAAGESAGQCGPCMFGLPALESAWADLLAHPDDDAALTRVRRLLGLLPGRGACHHPDGVARMAASALRAFDIHLAGHRLGRCTARRDVHVG